jgi:multidrug efflux pump subunit AcrB
MSVIAVFVPVAYMGGIVGRFFRDFGITVAFAVLVSLFVSFTLDPMLSSRWFDPDVARTGKRHPIARVLDRFNAWFDRTADRYRGVIAWALDHRKTVMGIAALAFFAGLVVFGLLQSEFFPEYDAGEFRVTFVSAPDASLSETEGRLRAVLSVVQDMPEVERTYATITYRIPADRWDEAISALRALATTVVGEQTQALEVTGQLVDLEARIKNLRASEAALQEILAKATKVSDILEVEARLSDVRGQIEALEAQRVTLENQVAYGTLTVGFSAPVVAVTEVQEGWDPLGEIDRAVAAMLNLMQGVATGAIWFAIVILPLALVVLAVLGIALLVGRRVFGGRRPSSPDAGPSAPDAGPSSPGAGPSAPDEAPAAA